MCVPQEVGSWGFPPNCTVLCQGGVYGESVPPCSAHFRVGTSSCCGFGHRGYVQGPRASPPLTLPSALFHLLVCFKVALLDLGETVSTGGRGSRIGQESQWAVVLPVTEGTQTGLFCFQSYFYNKRGRTPCLTGWLCCWGAS